MVQSALCSIPIYYMSLFTIPASISCQLEKIMRDFLWSNNEAEKGFHWVKWDDVCLPKREGGLGIRPLRGMNKALKVKWLWRFAREDNTLWKALLKMKYDVDKLGWWSKKSPNPHGVGCWKSITSELDLFKSLVQFKVGNGFRVLFGMMCGVENNRSRITFRISLGWHVSKMQQ